MNVNPQCPICKRSLVPFSKERFKDGTFSKASCQETFWKWVCVNPNCDFTISLNTWNFEPIIEYAPKTIYGEN